jgi:hypothetical protein
MKKFQLREYAIWIATTFAIVTPAASAPSMTLDGVTRSGVHDATPDMRVAIILQSKGNAPKAKPPAKKSP